MASSYCLKKVTHIITSSQHHITLNQNVRLWHKCKMLMALSNNNCVTRSGPLAVGVQFVNVRDLGTIDSLLKHTSLSVVNWVEVLWSPSDFVSRPMRYAV